MSEELSVAQSDAVGTISSHQVLIMLAYLDYAASLVPFEGVRADLVLDANMVPDFERRKAPGVF